MLIANLLKLFYYVKMQTKNPHFNDISVGKKFASEEASWEFLKKN